MISAGVTRPNPGRSRMSGKGQFPDVSRRTAARSQFTPASGCASSVAASLGKVGGVDQRRTPPRKRREARTRRAGRGRARCGWREEQAVALGRRSSVVVSSPADGTAYGAKQNEDQSDDQEDDPNHPQNGDLGDETDYQQDDAQSDHSFS